MLIIVSGLPGTGKTTFAKALSDRLEIPHLNTDIIRDELKKRGQYDPETKKLIYRELFERTIGLLRRGEDVIVDATFYQEEYRQPYFDLAATAGYPLRWIELKAAEEVIRNRVEQKRDYSEADFSVYRKIKAAYEPLQVSHLVLSSAELQITEMLEQAEQYIKEGKA